MSRECKAERQKRFDVPSSFREYSHHLTQLERIECSSEELLVVLRFAIDRDVARVQQDPSHERILEQR